MFNRRFFMLATLLLTIITICLGGCSAPTTPVVASEPAPTTAPIQLTPRPGTAIIKGTLVDAVTQKAPIEGNLFLGEIRTLNTGKPVVELDRATAPYAIPAPNGEFYFVNVTPGRYGLIFFTPEFNFLIDKTDNSGESMIFDIAADQVLDVGKIEITFP